MNKIILVILISICSQSFSQGKGSFGVNFGLRVPHIAGELRFNYLITDRFEVNLGLDGNAIRTLGRLGGIKYQIVQFSEAKRSLSLGLNYDNSSKGVYGVHDELTGNNGTYSIPNNQYLIPQIGFRSYGAFKNFDDSILKIGKGGSFEVLVGYRLPVNYNSPVFRSGYYSDEGLNAVTKFADGGLNVSFRFGFWF